MRKGQGLPLSTIVLAGLAVLVLVSIAAIYGKGISLFGGQTSKTYHEVELKDFIRECQEYCQMLKQSIINYIVSGQIDLNKIIGNHIYCKRFRKIGTEEYHCYQVVSCSVTYDSPLISISGTIECNSTDTDCSDGKCYGLTITSREGKTAETAAPETSNSEDALPQNEESRKIAEKYFSTVTLEGLVLFFAS